MSFEFFRNRLFFATLGNFPNNLHFKLSSTAQFNWLKTSPLVEILFEKTCICTKYKNSPQIGKWNDVYLIFAIHTKWIHASFWAELIWCLSTFSQHAYLCNSGFFFDNIHFKLSSTGQFNWFKPSPLVEILFENYLYKIICTKYKK